MGSWGNWDPERPCSKHLEPDVESTSSPGLIKSCECQKPLHFRLAELAKNYIQRKMHTCWLCLRPAGYHLNYKRYKRACIWLRTIFFKAQIKHQPAQLQGTFSMFGCWAEPVYREVKEKLFTSFMLLLASRVDILHLKNTIAKTGLSASLHVQDPARWAGSHVVRPSQRRLATVFCNAFLQPSEVCIKQILRYSCFRSDPSIWGSITYYPLHAT